MVSKLLAAALLILPLSAQDDLMAHARRLSAEAIGIDSHIDTIQRVLIGGADLSQRSTQGHVDFPRLHEGGMNAPFFALWVPVYYQGAEAVRRTLDLRDAMQSPPRSTSRIRSSLPSTRRTSSASSNPARSRRFWRLKAATRSTTISRVLRKYYRMGIRAMTLTHFRNNNWADSSTDKPVHNGLTRVRQRRGPRNESPGHDRRRLACLG